MLRRLVVCVAGYRHEGLSQEGQEWVFHGSRGSLEEVHPLGFDTAYGLLNRRWAGSRYGFLRPSNPTQPSADWARPTVGDGQARMLTGLREPRTYTMPRLRSSSCTSGDSMLIGTMNPSIMTLPV